MSAAKNSGSLTTFLNCQGYPASSSAVGEFHSSCPAVQWHHDNLLHVKISPSVAGGTVLLSTAVTLCTLVQDLFTAPHPAKCCCLNAWQVKTQIRG